MRYRIHTKVRTAPGSRYIKVLIANVNIENNRLVKDNVVG